LLDVSAGGVPVTGDRWPNRWAYRFQENNVRQSLTILLSWFLVVGFSTLLAPRVTPPGGLVGVDYVLMCSLPFGAFFAGRRWYNGPVFLFYGMLGMLAFVPGFLADGRLGLKYEYGNSTPIDDVIAWTIGTLGVAIICRMTGWAAHESQRTAPTGDEFLDA
jgi:hypothetical protein